MRCDGGMRGDVFDLGFGWEILGEENLGWHLEGGSACILKIRDWDYVENSGEQWVDTLFYSTLVQINLHDRVISLIKCSIPGYSHAKSLS